MEQAMNNNDATPRPSFASSSFLRRKSTWMAALLRIYLILGGGILLPKFIIDWAQSRALRSIIEDPTFTPQSLLEALATQKLFAGISTSNIHFADAYRLRSVHLPPLLLAVLNSLVIWTTTCHLSNHVLNAIMGFLLLLVDLIIATSLERLATSALMGNFTLCCPNENDENDEKTDLCWESKLETEMPETIRAPLSHVFGLSGKRTTQVQDDTEAFVIRQRDIPCIIASLYFCSPLTILNSSLYTCFQTIGLLLLLCSLDSAAHSHKRLNKTKGGDDSSLVYIACWLALSAYVQTDLILFHIPVTLLIRTKQKAQKVCYFVFILFIFLHFLSFLLIGGKDYLAVVGSTHFYNFQITRLSPSLSTLWYFGMEVFYRFQIYFTILLGGVPYILIAPLTIRLRRYPMTLVAIFWLLKTLIRPPGTLFNLQVGFCFMLLSPQSLARMQRTMGVISLCALFIPVFLYLVLYKLWLETGTGEANFLYFQCLAYNVFVVILVVDFTGASLRREKANRIVENKVRIQEIESHNKKDEDHVVNTNAMNPSDASSSASHAYQTTPRADSEEKCAAVLSE